MLLDASACDKRRRAILAVPTTASLEHPMLKTLRIRNLATIEDLRVELGTGLNVLTGETGAGKSIVVEALGLACGQRADSSLLRAGADRAVVEAAFEPDDREALAAFCDERGLEPGDPELIVRREIAANGSGRVWINGSPATVAVLRELCEQILDLHEQHEARGLLSPERQLAHLDAFGGHDAELAATAAAARAASAARARLEHLRGLAATGRERADALAATVREIRGLDPKDGEVDALARERTLLQNGSRIAELLEEAIDALDGDDGGAVASTHAAERRVMELASIDPTLADLAQRTVSARLELADARETLDAYRRGLDFDPSRLEAIEARRAALSRLLARWGPGEQDARRAADDAERELATLDDLEGETARAEADCARAHADYSTAAGRLTAKRAAAAERLQAAMARELAPLALGRARFEVALPHRAAEDAPHPSGAERAVFHIAANPGEPSRPIAKAASGGELSRIMLALHVVLDAGEAGRVLVFDEADAGVSGAVAAAVGARLARLSRGHQVLCVTHLPQVAAHADGHYHVAKRVVGGRTRTEITALSGEARLDELARMLGGRTATKASRGNAAALLVEAKGEMTP